MITKKSFLIFTSIALLFLVACNKTDDKTTDNLPNIVFIYADDLGYGDVSFQNPESKIQTPNIDRVAEQGMVFTNAHSPASICLPSRMGLLTGRYCWRTGLKRGNGPRFAQMRIEDDRETLASVLKQAGYNTAAFGKWGIRFDYKSFFKGELANENEEVELREIDPEFDLDYTKVLHGPDKIGFDYSFVRAVLTSDKGKSPNGNPHWHFENGKAYPNSPLESKWDNSKSLGTITRKTVAYIESICSDKQDPLFKQEQGKPFFVYYSPHVPHEPLTPSPEFKGKSNAGDYGDFVENFDWSVGEILNALERNGVAKNTIVIISSDNGPEKTAYQRIQDFQHYSMGDWRGVKRDAWEGGHHVPMFVKWPGTIQNNSSCQELVGLTDWLATFAEIAHVELPNNAGEDSESILPILKGKTLTQPVRESIIHFTLQGQFAIRKGDWVFIDHFTGSNNEEPEWFREKLNVKPDDFPGELYNLKEDPQETTNLFGKNPEKVKELSRLLEKQKESGRSVALR